MEIALKIVKNSFSNHFHIMLIARHQVPFQK